MQWVARRIADTIGYNAAMAGKRFEGLPCKPFLLTAGKKNTPGLLDNPMLKQFPVYPFFHVFQRKEAFEGRVHVPMGVYKVWNVALATGKPGAKT